MKRRSLFLSAAAVMMVWGLMTPAARAVSLQDVLGTTVIDDGLAFTFVSYTPTGTAPAASGVAITFFTGAETGFTLNASFGAAAGTVADGDLKYIVTAAPGTTIVDAVLTANPSLGVGTGELAGVTETLTKNSFLGPVITSLTVLNTPGSVTATFPGNNPIWVDKDIEAIGGTGGVSMSSVSQGFSTIVPEPTSIALLGIGMTGFLAFRRLFKRISVA